MFEIDQINGTVGKFQYRNMTDSWDISSKNMYEMTATLAAEENIQHSSTTF